MESKQHESSHALIPSSNSGTSSTGQADAVPSMEEHFEEFLLQQANNPAFQAYHHQNEDNGEPDLDQTICAEDQTVVSEITMASGASLFRGPLYQNPAAIDGPEDNDIDHLFHNNNNANNPQRARQAALTLPTLEETQDISTHGQTTDATIKEVLPLHGGNDKEMTAESLKIESPDPNVKELIPGAYSATPGFHKSRIEQTPLPQHLRGDSSQQHRISPVEVTDFLPDETDLPPPTTFHNFQSKTPDEIATAKKYRVCYLISAFILLLLAIILPTLLVLGGKEEGAGATSDRIDILLEDTLIVPNLTQFTIEALEDPISYQSLAYAWAEAHIDWDTFEPWHKQQRFAMACVFHAFNGITWTSTSWLSHGRFYRYARYWMDERANECQWQERLNSSGCDTNGRILRLDFRDANSLYGFLPREVAFLSKLETIDFSNSKLDTTLEALLPLNATNTLPALKATNMSTSSLVGDIPSSLGLLSALANVDLSQNSLCWTIPSELGLLSQLTSLTLDHNNLSGPIPAEIGSLPYLASFAIDNNTNIDASLPEGFCNMDNFPFNLITTNWCWGIDQCCSF